MTISPEDLAKEVLDIGRRRIDHFYHEQPSKPVTVRVNVDLYYEIDTKYLPTWMGGDAITKAVETSFEDAGPPTFASLSSVLRQTPNEVSIIKFFYDH